MNLNYPRRLWALVVILVFGASLSFAQNQPSEKAQNYLDLKGEITFEVTINDPKEIEDFNYLSIVNYDANTNKLKLWANAQQFELFLNNGIAFEVNDIDNDAAVSAPDLKPAQDPIKATSQPCSAITSLPLAFPLTDYPTYDEYECTMISFAANYPGICELVDIGGTTEGVGGGDKRLLFIKISDNVSTREQEPRLMYTSSMHGDEIAGYPMMLDLIDYLTTTYYNTGHPDHTRVKDLIDNSEIWINPSANPDGTYYLDPTNTSVANARRANDNGWDLNRNYPDNIGGAHPDGNPAYELETQHFMTLADNNHFVISANFHGGTEVVNYPWDNTYTRHADDDWFFFISQEYAANCQADGPAGYMDAMYTNYVFPGVTNGADWYRVEGGRQDYMNYYQFAKETTIELSNLKTPPASELDDHWFWNQEALIEYMIQGTYGFRGLVKDAVTGNPIQATIKLVGHDNTNSHTETELPMGDYYRPTIAGTYDILYEADCYQPFTLTNQTIANYQTINLADVLLTPIAGTPPSNLAANNVTGNGATISWDAITGADYDYRYRVVGSPSWTTVNTSNATENLSGLTPSTQYEVQVRSTCNSNTSSYSTSEIFTTLNTVTVHEGYFETGWDGWSDGGVDVSRYTGGTLSYENLASIQLQDNSGVASAMTQGFDLSPYSSVTISFWFRASGMENGEDFWLRYNDGTGWATIDNFVAGTDFNNGTFYYTEFTLDSGSYNLTVNSQFRIQNDASQNNDRVYIDQVIITGTPLCTPSTEICDGIDNNCDGNIDEGVTNTYYADNDNDTFGDPTNSIQSCSAPAGYVADNTDCDDTNNTVYPGAPELCDGLDNDCNALVDDTLTFTTYYADTDNDGYGNASSTVSTCDGAPAGYVVDNTDCDDTNNTVYPGAPEICDGLDNDCNALVDDTLTFITYYADTDNDGYGDASSTVSTCDGAPAGYVADNTDCDDTNNAINPVAIEVCDGIDNNCDGNIDEGVTNTYYADTDNDTFGDPGNTVQACSAPVGYVSDNSDCDDTDGAINPNTIWYLDSDSDSYAASTVTQCANPGAGYVLTVLPTTDCDDGNGAVNPAATEICDGIDNNCDGNIDEGVTNTYYADTDNDGYGDPGNAVQACSLPGGYSINNFDCDDTDGSINPDTVWYLDGDSDSYAASTLTQCTNPGAGYVLTVLPTTDCDDTNNAINPGAVEVCDGIDNNCDGNIDEGVTNTYYADTDNDTFGDPGNTIQACSAPAGYVADNTDCDDTDGSINPNTIWYLDGDSDSYAVSTVTQCTSPGVGYVLTVLPTTDCDDTNNAINPGAVEVCDGIDNN
ncbi:MAG: fibronectin type III domain-containing protein, partial [Bacteroidia bacterium]|nr:fibronectin type III domain-containing protein [Bacteroidia bacterium]